MTCVPSVNRLTHTTRPVRPGAAILGLILLSAASALAKKQFVMPQVQPAATYALHEAHTDEKVTLAAEPYDVAPKNEIFTIKWADHDMLPVLIVITNDGDQPITVGSMDVQLITAAREKIPAATSDDIYRRLSNPKDPQRKMPIPLPTGRAKGSVNHDQLDEMDRSTFAARVVSPTPPAPVFSSSTSATWTTRSPAHGWTSPASRIPMARSCFTLIFRWVGCPRHTRSQRRLLLFLGYQSRWGHCDIASKSIFA